MLAYFLGFDPVFLVILGIGLLLSLITAGRVKSTFARYSKVGSRSGLNGAQVARAILQANDIRDVTVEPVAGSLTDHYDPRAKTLRLSESVYGSTSVAALGVAAHEVGHAIQHATAYGPLKFRSAWVPVATIGSNVSMLLLGIGMMLAYGGGSQVVAWIGVGAFALTTVFTVVTLPVEFDASRRALATLEQSRVLASDELPGARAVLNAAAMTYVAAAVMSLMQLLYFVMRLLDRRND
ncbi:MAG: zinc metallopeptidase [Planctomycetota bacterium]